MIEIDNNSRVLFFGDSVTDIDFNRQYDHLLHGKQVYALNIGEEIKKKFPNAEVFYKGIVDDRTYNLCNRMDDDCIALKPNVVIMLVGGNDAWEEYSPELCPPPNQTLESNMDELFGRMKNELDDVQILYVLPFLVDTLEEFHPFIKTLNRFRERLKLSAQANGIEILDLQPVLDEAQKTFSPQELSVDSFHPTDLCHKIISDEILKHLSLDTE